MKEIEIYGDYIQLDQFLKKENMISSGGETGNFIEKHEIFVNGVIIKEKRKKRKVIFATNRSAWRRCLIIGRSGTFWKREKR